MSGGNDADEKIGQLSMLEQNMQNTSVQKQNFHLQLLEIESALKEVESAPEAYKIVANIMVKADKEAIKADLSEKKDIIELRIKSLEKQEGKLRDKVAELQKEVLGSMEAGK